MLRMLFLSLALCAVDIATAQTPELSRIKPTICRVTKPASEWLPTPADITALERALPAYFSSLDSSKRDHPTAGKVYGRQYTGIVRGGKKLIYGSYYPAATERPFSKPGGCWITADGGSDYWSIVFDPKSKSVIDMFVNGVG